MQKLYILDAVNFLFRSYYAIGPMTGPHGESTGALYGFIRTLYKLIRDFSPDHLVAVFDGPNNKQYRTKIYQEYKSHRKGMPEDLFPQLELAIEFCEMAGIAHLEIAGFEADDVMGSVAVWAAKNGAQVYLCTSDKDMCQLVDDRIHVLNVHKDNLDIDAVKVKEVYGVRPDQIVDFLALMGDSSDNIPGIEGFGPKTASSLLNEFETLDHLLQFPDKVKGERKQQALKEGKQIALMSRELAKLCLDVEIPKEETFFHLRSPDTEKVQAFFNKHHFVSLLKELGETAQPIERAVSYHTVDDEASLNDLVHRLCQKKFLVIDTETTSVHPLQARIVGFGFACEAGEAWYIPCNGNLGKHKVLDLLSPLFQTKSIGWIGHNIKYDLHALANEGLQLSNIAFDTMIASYILAPHTPRHNLDDLSLVKFGKKKIPIESLIGKGQKQITMDKVPIDQVAAYCSEDADYTFRLFTNFSAALKQERLDSILHTIELPLIPVLFKMERRGICIDIHRMERLSSEFRKQLDELQEEIFSIAGESFNLNSPKQLSVILFEKMGITPPKKTVTGFSTSADVLEGLKEKSPIIEKILHYRLLEKLRSTYTDTLLEDVSPQDNHIHCTFNQSVAATGRLSCQDPNLQNIPIRSNEGKAIRAAFIPSKDNFLMLSADYSQIELRLVAHLSEDPALIKAFMQGEDVHAYTASLVFDVPLENVTSDMRYKAKAVNFGILYGQGPFGLSQQLGITQKEASQLIEIYFSRYPNVKKFIESCKEQARATGFAISMFGRKRPIPDIHSKNHMIRSAAERLAVNTPLQSTNADLIKLAMIDLDSKLKLHPKLGSILLQIHDELVLEGPKEEIEKLGILAKESMEGVFSLKVPLVVDISIGKNWAEC